MNRKVESDRGIGAEVKLRVDVQQGMHLVMTQKGVTQAELASRLGVSEARVSTLFSSHANLTLRTVARVFHALCDECSITSRALDEMHVNFLTIESVWTGALADMVGRTIASDWASIVSDAPDPYKMPVEVKEDVMPVPRACAA